MKIDKYSKLKNGMYKLDLKDEKNTKSVVLSEELILKYNQLLKKEIDEDMLSDLEEENIKYEAYNLAIKYLKNRQRCKNEIKEYLHKKGFSSFNIDEVIHILEKQGYLNEEKYIKSFINDKINLSNDGPIKIKNELAKLKLDLDIIEKELSIFNYELEYEKVRHIIDKLKKSNKKSEYEFKIKTRNYLVNLGYNISLINECLENISISDEEFMEKEYDKLYKKYSKKYSGRELEYKINNALYQKGFRN